MRNLRILPARRGEDAMAVVEVDAKHGTGQSLRHDSVELDSGFFHRYLVLGNMPSRAHDAGLRAPGGSGRFVTDTVRKRTKRRWSSSHGVRPDARTQNNTATVSRPTIAPWL